MPVVPMNEVLDRASADRYGVAACNILNVPSIEAVLEAAVEEPAPVILPTSVQTVRTYGRERLFHITSTKVRDVPVPVTLHLDHCPSRRTDDLLGFLAAPWAGRGDVPARQGQDLHRRGTA